MTKIAIFYHGVFFLGRPPERLPNAATIVADQMSQMSNFGLLDAADEIHVGINGEEESIDLAAMTIPAKADVTFHGLDSRSENLTILMLENWAKTHPGWYVLYLHSKGATNKPGSDDAKFAPPWRGGMMFDLVVNWRKCVDDLQSGFDIVCSYWMWNAADGTQHIPAGNFWWAKSDFIATLPSIHLRERIKMSGIESLESRYEAEVWIGNGKKPTVKSYRPRMWWWRYS